MLIAPSVTANVGQEVSVPITLTDTLDGLDFWLYFDPIALEFISIALIQSGIAAVNVDPDTGALRDEGLIKVSEMDLADLPEIDEGEGPIATIVFLVHGPSDLTFSNIVAGGDLGAPVSIETQDGAILIEESTMNFEAFWDAIPASYGVTSVRVLVGDTVDPADGSYTQVAEVSVPATVAPFSLGANSGTKYCYGVAVDAEGDVGPPLTPVPVSTDLALPALTGFGVRVV